MLRGKGPINEPHLPKNPKKYSKVAWTKFYLGMSDGVFDGSKVTAVLLVITRQSETK